MCTVYDQSLKFCISSRFDLTKAEAQKLYLNIPYTLTLHVLIIFIATRCDSMAFFITLWYVFFAVLWRFVFKSLAKNYFLLHFKLFSFFKTLHSSQYYSNFDLYLFAACIIIAIVVFIFNTILIYHCIACFNMQYLYYYY